MAVYPLARRLLFRLDAETAHETGLAALRILQAVPGLARALTPAPSPALAQTLLGRGFRPRGGETGRGRSGLSSS